MDSGLDEPPTKLELDHAKAAVASGQAALDSALAKEAALLAGPSATELEIQRQSVILAEIAVVEAQDIVEYRALRAPFDGVVGSVGVVPGDRVGASTVAFVVTDLDSIRVDLTISESDLIGLTPGLVGAALFDSMPGQPYVLKITGISTVPTVTQGVVTYPVQAQILRGADIIAEREKLRRLLASLGGTAGISVGGALAGFGGGGGSPAGARDMAAIQSLLNPEPPAVGMNATVIVVIDVKEDVLLVPSEAVHREGRTSYVVVPTEDGGTEQRDVRLGSTDGTRTEVLSGLEEGEVVLVGTTVSASAGAEQAASLLPRIHRRTALGTALEEARGCSCESGIMVL